jgi:hypothetical protein
MARRDASLKTSVGRFGMHSGHGWSGCWLDLIAFDPKPVDRERPCARMSRDRHAWTYFSYSEGGDACRNLNGSPSLN